MAPPTNEALLARLGKLEHKVAVLERAEGQLADKFCLYWLGEGNSARPVFAIKLRQRKDGKADLLVLSESLSAPDLKSNKEQLKPDDELKGGKWEPLVLPLDLLAEVMKIEAEEKEKASTKDHAKDELTGAIFT
jgi:hypothetical protein